MLLLAVFVLTMLGRDHATRAGTAATSLCRIGLATATACMLFLPLFLGVRAGTLLALPLCLPNALLIALGGPCACAACAIKTIL